jgi:hypothetical protein
LVAIVLIVQLFGVLLGSVLDLFLVDPVFTLGLGKLVDFSTDETSKKLFGEAVANSLACDRELDMA